MSKDRFWQRTRWVVLGLGGVGATLALIIAFAQLLFDVQTNAASNEVEGRVISIQETQLAVQQDMLEHIAKAATLQSGDPSSILTATYIAVEVQKLKGTQEALEVTRDAIVKTAIPVTFQPWLIEHAHSGSISELDFSSTGYELASGGADGFVRLWSPPWTQPSYELGPSGGLVEALSFSPDNQSVVSVGSDQGLMLWSGPDFETNSVKVMQPGHYQDVVFNPEGSEIAVISMTGGFRVIGIDNPHVRVTNFNEGVLSAITYSPDGSMLVMGNSIGQILSINTPIEGEHDWGCIASTEPVTSIAFSPDSKMLAVGSDDGQLHILQMRDCIWVNSFQAHIGSVNALAYSPLGTFLVSGASDGIKVWSLDSFYAVRLADHSDEVEAIAFSTDGKLFASGDASGNIIVWNINQNSD